MNLRYKVSVSPYGRHPTIEEMQGYRLTFRLARITDDIDKFVTMWLDNYGDAIITIEVDKS